MMKKVSIKGFNLQEKNFLTATEKREVLGGSGSDCGEPDGWWELSYQICVIDEDCPSNYCDQRGASYGRCYECVYK